METNQNFNEPKDEWGGSWTSKKLDAFSKYVWSYLTIMKSRHWKTIYFDGFAGCGTKGEKYNTEQYKLLNITSEEENLYQGAAERVLSLKDDLSFDYYYFIDKDKDSLESLEKRLSNVSGYSDKRVAYKHGDANQWLNKLADAMKGEPNKFAALVFLDPFGMQVDWNSIEQLKGTRSDVWILVPTGVIVNRLLDKKGELKHVEKLESFFGLNANEIRNFFYSKMTTQTLFGVEEKFLKVTKPIEKIAQLYASRMKTVWNCVTEKPLVLLNSKKVPIFHFVFASNNSNALKIANQIIKKV